MKLPGLKSIKKRIVLSKPVLAILHWMRTHSIPGFHDVPVYDVINFLRKEIQREALITRANAIAFSLFLSLFPTILVLFSLIAYLPISRTLYDIIQTNIKEIMPGSAGEMLVKTIGDVLLKPRGDLFSISFFLVIFFASNGMMMLMRGFEKSYHLTYHKRTEGTKRLIALGLTFMMGFLMVVSVILVILGNTLFRYITEHLDVSAKNKLLFTGVRWIVIITMFYTVITNIYRYGASARKKFHYFSPGATLATVLSLLTSVLFSFYVDNFGNYDKVYGSIATIIVVMVWLQINAFILLVGFELNSSIAVNRDLRTMKVENT